MSLTLPKTCSMGGSRTGLTGTIGVTLLDPDGTVHTARATAGIYEIGGGCYGKEITFDNNWKGSILWDTGGGSPVYASEEYVIEGLLDTVEEDTNELQGLISASKIAAQVKGMDTGVVTATAIAADAIGSSEFAQAAADKVWATAARALTDKAGFSISGTKQTLDALNDITAASVWSAGSRALSTPADYKADISALALEATLSDIKGTGFSKDTHSLPQCLTATGFATQNPPSQNLADYKATGFSTHAAADIWSVATRALTDKVGFGLSGAGILAIWHELLTNIVTADTIGKLIKDNVNAQISSRSSHNAAAIWSAASRELSTPNNYKADVSSLALEDGGRIENIEGDTNEIQGKVPDDKIAGSSDAASLESKHGTGSWEGGGTSSEIADAVLNEQLSDHIDSGSLGEKIYGMRARVPLSPWSRKEVNKLFKLIDDMLIAIDVPEDENLKSLLETSNALRAQLETFDSGLSEIKELIISIKESQLKIVELKKLIPKDQFKFKPELESLKKSFTGSLTSITEQLAKLPTSFSDVRNQNFGDELFAGLRTLEASLSKSIESLKALPGSTQKQDAEVIPKLDSAAEILSRLDKMISFAFVTNLSDETLEEYLKSKEVVKSDGD